MLASELRLTSARADGRRRRRIWRFNAAPRSRQLCLRLAACIFCMGQAFVTTMPYNRRLSQQNKVAGPDLTACCMHACLQACWPPGACTYPSEVRGIVSRSKIPSVAAMPHKQLRHTASLPASPCRINPQPHFIWPGRIKDSRVFPDPSCQAYQSVIGTPCLTTPWPHASLNLNPQSTQPCS